LNRYNGNELPAPSLTLSPKDGLAMSEQREDPPLNATHYCVPKLG